MTLQNYEKLRQVIIEANPELSKLKHGDSVKYIYPSIDTEGYHEYISGLIWEPYFSNINQDRINVCNYFGGRTILTQDLVLRQINIRLADVLLALNKCSNKFSIDTSGNFLYEKWDGTKMAYSAFNLTKDNLDLQSDPTKQFLFHVLVKKLNRHGLNCKCDDIECKEHYFDSNSEVLVKGKV